MNGDDDNNSKVGFRDIYRAVGESEARLTTLIQTAVGPLGSTILDHERRLREIEVGGSPEAKQAIALAGALDTRVTATETAINANRDRNAGVVTTLGAQRTFLILVCSAIAGMVGVIDILARLSPAK